MFKKRKEKITKILGFFLVIILFSVFVCLGIAQCEGMSKKAEYKISIIPFSPSNAGAATHLRAEVDCDPNVPRKGIARLSWNTAKKPGTEQRAQVTIYRNGFETGKFDMSDAMPPDQTSLVWDRLRGQAIHLWRVLTLQEEGWVASETLLFEGPTCVADFFLKP